MEVVHLKDFQQFKFFYLAIHKLIIEKQQNKFVFNSWTFGFHKIYFKQTRMNYLN